MDKAGSKISSIDEYIIQFPSEKTYRTTYYLPDPAQICKPSLKRSLQSKPAIARKGRYPFNTEMLFQVLAFPTL